MAIDERTRPAPPADDREVDRAVGLAQTAMGYLVACFGPYLAGIAAELDRSPAGLVWLTSTFGAGLVLAAVTGPFVLRAGAGLVLRLACAAIALGAFGMALSPHLVAAGAGSVLVGLGCAAIALVTPSLLRGPRAARRIALAVGVASAAGVCGPLAFGALESAGLPGRWAILAAVPVLAVVLTRRTVPAPVEAPVASARAPVGPAALAWLRIVLGVGCEFCFVVWAVARLAETGVSLGAASALGASFGVGMALGRLVGPRFVDRSWAVTAAAATTAAGTLLVYAGEGPFAVTAGIAVASLGISPLYPIMLARLVAVPGLTVGHAASIGSLASGTAILAAPAALGWLDGLVGMREAFLLPIPLLALLLVLSRRR
ncbi:MFS transporter [Glycomyces paridis]|uniref:MFS transporter n=1 Tax=Glycomyces paridis TaxID=2126555 RepID=A0A4V6T6B4_9ACTN|nr:MFS transporter [Glycomyces paridis]THV27306.1 MFS transporter [Glycomyces paridis]